MILRHTKGQEKQDKANIRSRLRYDAHVGLSDREDGITVSNMLKSLMEKGDNMHHQLFQLRGGNSKEESNGKAHKEK